MEGPIDVKVVIESGKIEVLQEMVKENRIGVDDVVDAEYGETALHVAAYCGDEEIVLYLISAGANVNAIGSKSTATPLHSAAAGGHAGICSILLAFGTNLHALTATGWTPMHSAALRSFDHVCWLLEKCGAKQWRNNDGFTPRDLLEKSKGNANGKGNRNGSGNGNGNALGMDLLVNGKLRIQIVSDIHIEFYPDFQSTKDIIKPIAPIVALCGDIGSPLLPNYEPFILYLSTIFKLVLVLTGNHEYYNIQPHKKICMSEIDNIIAEICCKRPNIHFLNNSKVKIGDYDILGCTLWGSIDRHQRSQMSTVLNDFNYIYTDPFTRFTPDAFNARFEESLRWLEERIGEGTAAKRKIVVLTHHTPSFQVPLAGCGWSSSLEYLFAKGGTNVLLWGFGHTHANVDKVVEGTRLVCNQKGYTTENVKQWKPDFFVEV